jgi:hypothetical protein
MRINLLSLRPLRKGNAICGIFKLMNEVLELSSCPFVRSVPSFAYGFLLVNWVIRPSEVSRSGIWLT